MSYHFEDLIFIPQILLPILLPWHLKLSPKVWYISSAPTVTKNRTNNNNNINLIDIKKINICRIYYT